MTLLDVAMAHAARSASAARRPTTPGVVTIEMKTSFMRPAAGPLVAQRPAAAPHRDDGLLRGLDRTTPRAAPASHATGTFKYVQAACRSGGRDASSAAPLSTD